MVNIFTFSQSLSDGRQASPCANCGQRKEKNTNMLFCYEAWEHSVEEDKRDLRLDLEGWWGCLCVCVCVGGKFIKEREYFETLSECFSASNQTLLMCFPRLPCKRLFSLTAHTRNDLDSSEGQLVLAR